MLHKTELQLSKLAFDRFFLVVVVVVVVVVVFFFSEDPSSETTGETRKSSNCRKVTKMISLKQSNLYIFLFR